MLEEGPELGFEVVVGIPVGAGEGSRLSVGDALVVGFDVEGASEGSPVGFPLGIMVGVRESSTVGAVLSEGLALVEGTALATASSRTRCCGQRCAARPA